MSEVEATERQALHPILENKNLERHLMWEQAWFSISIREITFREQELNWLFAKYKRLENNPLYGTLTFITWSMGTGTNYVVSQFQPCDLNLISDVAGAEEVRHPRKAQ